MDWNTRWKVKDEDEEVKLHKRNDRDVERDLVEEKEKVLQE